MVHLGEQAKAVDRRLEWGQVHRSTLPPPNWTHEDSTQSSRLVLVCHNQTGHMKILLNQAGWYYSVTTKLDTWRFYSIKQVRTTVSQPNWTHEDSTQSSRFCVTTKLDTWRFDSTKQVLCHNQTGNMKILLNQGGLYSCITTKLYIWRLFSIT